MIIIPGQSGTYRHSQRRVTGLLAESGQTVSGVTDDAVNQMPHPGQARRPTRDARLPGLIGESWRAPTVVRGQQSAGADPRRTDSGARAVLLVAVGGPDRPAADVATAATRVARVLSEAAGESALPATTSQTSCRLCAKISPVTGSPRKP
jgi:hypothetical protein